MNKELEEVLLNFASEVADEFGGDTDEYPISKTLTDEALASLRKIMVEARIEELKELEALPNVYPEKIDGQYTHVQAIYKSAITDRIKELEALYGEVEL